MMTNVTERDRYMAVRCMACKFVGGHGRDKLDSVSGLSDWSKGPCGPIAVHMRASTVVRRMNR
jgi:hypothetical protein